MVLAAPKRGLHPRASTQRTERDDRARQRQVARTDGGVGHAPAGVNIYIEVDRVAPGQRARGCAPAARDGGHTGHHPRADQHALEPVRIFKRRANVPRLKPLGQRIGGLGQYAGWELEQVRHGPLLVVPRGHVGRAELNPHAAQDFAKGKGFAGLPGRWLSFGCAWLNRRATRVVDAAELRVLGWVDGTRHFVAIDIDEATGHPAHARRLGIQHAAHGAL